MRIGIKRFSIGFYLRNKRVKWHSGKYTLIISRQKHIDDVYGYGMDWWMFIPSGKPCMGWGRFIRREWVNFRLLFR